MNKKIKTKKAFTFVELIIVVVIILLMSVVLLAKLNKMKSSKDVSNAARQLAAQLRLLQNNAINGTQKEGKNICKIDADFSPSVAPAYRQFYFIHYFACDGSGSNNEKTWYNSKNDKGDVILNGNAGMHVVFDAPLGRLSAGTTQKVTLRSISSPITYATVCVYPAGNVCDFNGDVACPSACPQ